jgi:UDP-N-acetylmuramate--alanine ligase
MAINLINIKSIYFIGAGGIGMSALVRYFLSKGLLVAGYDRTESSLTKALESEGASIHYEDNTDMIPSFCKDAEHTLVVYTPAIPADHKELNFFKDNGFIIMKRAQVLGEITKSSRGLCVAGTHGKTTTSSMIAHLLKQSHVDCNAFLGGILKNYSSNLLLSDKSDFTVIEADEFDRSFHHLRPYIAVITSADPDHLDIYGTPEAYKESFDHFTSLIRPDGVLLIKKGINVSPHLQDGVSIFTYSAKEDADFYASNIRIGNGTILYDFNSPSLVIKDVEVGVPVVVNIENSVAAIAVALLSGVTPEEAKAAIKTFEGARRRFDFKLKRSDIVVIDDYAHHPQELKASIESVKSLYPHKKVTGIFQPHLFSRTRDFAADFAKSLSLLDELILLDIYPARENPIPGVTSEIIYDRVTIPNKKMLKKQDLLFEIEKEKDNFEVVLMVGAGDIELLVEPVVRVLEKKDKS